MLVSDIYTVTIQVENIEDLYGIELDLTFDPTVVEVIDTYGFLPSIQIQSGDFFIPNTQIENVVDQTSGVIRYAGMLNGEQPGMSGDGDIAYIVFRGLIAGTTPISLKHVVLSDPASQTIPHSKQGGQLVVEIPVTVLDTTTIDGRVILERRESNAGVQVCIQAHCTITDYDGAYTLVDVPTQGTITAYYPGYLSAIHDYGQKASDEVEPNVVASPHITIPDVTLLAGDLNKDGIINLNDGVIMALAWKSTPADIRWKSDVDITDDDIIDVRDWVAIEANWNKTAPESWRQSGRRTLSTRTVRTPITTDVVAEASTHLKVMPVQSRLESVGGMTDVAINIENAKNLYGFSITLTFNPAILQARHVNLGAFLDVANRQVLANRVDNEAGIVELAVTQTYPARAKQGRGILSVIQFEGIADGRSGLQLHTTQLVDEMAQNAQFATSTIGSQLQIGSYVIHLPIIAR